MIGAAEHRALPSLRVHALPPRNASNASVCTRPRPARISLTASEVLSSTIRSTTPPK